MKSTSLTLATLLTLLNAADLPAQDWPQWRGPDRDGKATGFSAPETWPKELKQQWKSPVGIGDSTPALVGGKLYALGRQEADEVITCLDTATGKTNWEQRYPPDCQGKGLFALKIEAQGGTFTPTPLWTNVSLGARFTTPILKNGLLYGCNGKFYCADAKTGATLWTDTTARGMTAALVDTGPVIIATTLNSALVAFKPGGKEYAELAQYKVADTETWAHPVLSGKRIFIRDHDNVTCWTVE